MNRKTATNKKQRYQNLFLLGIFFLLSSLPPLLRGQGEGSNKPLIQSKARWVWQNPLPQGNHLFGLSFTDRNHGTAVGLYGTILRTIDGGRHWILQPSGTTS